MSNKKHSSSSLEGDYFDILVAQKKCKLIQNNDNFTPGTASKIPQQYSSMSSPFVKKSGNVEKAGNMLKRVVVDKKETATFDCNESVQLFDYDDNSDYNNDQYSLHIDLVTSDEKTTDRTSNVEQDIITTSGSIFLNNPNSIFSSVMERPQTQLSVESNPNKKIEILETLIIKSAVAPLKSGLKNTNSLAIPKSQSKIVFKEPSLIAEETFEKDNSKSSDSVKDSSQQSNSETVSKSSVTQQSLCLNQDVDALIKCAQNQDEKVTQLLDDLMNISEVNAKLAAHLVRSSREDF